MHKRLSATLALALLFGFLAPARADDKESRAIIDKAIKAMGGEEKLTKSMKATWKAKGTFHGMGVPIEYTGEWAMLAPEKSRVQINFEVNNEKAMFVMVYDGKQGWRKFVLGNDAMEMDFGKDELEEAKEGLWSSYVGALVPLKDAKVFTLAPLGEVKVENKPALGVKVSSKGHRDLNLYFDKDSGLLVKSEGRVRNEGGQEVEQEMFFLEYKEFNGAKSPTKIKINREGKLYVDGETTEYQVVDKFDEKTFTKP